MNFWCNLKRDDPVDHDHHRQRRNVAKYDYSSWGLQWNYLDLPCLHWLECSPSLSDKKTSLYIQKNRHHFFVMIFSSFDPEDPTDHQIVLISVKFQLLSEENNLSCDCCTLTKTGDERPWWLYHHISMSCHDRADLLSGHTCSNRHWNADLCYHGGDLCLSQWKVPWQFHVCMQLDALHDSTLYQ